MYVRWRGWSNDWDVSQVDALRAPAAREKISDQRLGDSSEAVFVASTGAKGGLPEASIIVGDCTSVYHSMPKTAYEH